MTKTDDQVREDRDSREFLQRRHLWPVQPGDLGRSPVCFVKRSDKRADGKEWWRFTGPCSWSDADQQFRVAAHDWGNGGAVNPRRYADVDALLADGWEVD